MDKIHNVTRRAAMLGAAASTAALAVPVASVAMAHAEPELPANIEQLAETFRDAAMKLDPRINECWVGYDELAKGPRDMRVMSVYLGRADTPFVSPPQPLKPTITELFGQWRDASYDSVRDANETDEEGDARFARYAELQDEITSMRPRSAREMAMQIVVETDDGRSEYRQAFFEGLRLIAQGI